MRHGEALHSQFDDTRELTEKGKIELSTTADFLKRSEISFKKIYHSGILRAMQSSEIIKEKGFPNLELEKFPYIRPMDNALSTLEEIEKLTEDSIIVSHLPFVGNLLGQMIHMDQDNSPVAFTQGTAVIIRRDENFCYEIIKSFSPSQY